jgi:hypothetical protein
MGRKRLLDVLYAVPSQISTPHRLMLRRGKVDTECRWGRRRMYWARVDVLLGGTTSRWARIDGRCAVVKVVRRRRTRRLCRSRKLGRMEGVQWRHWVRRRVPYGMDRQAQVHDGRRVGAQIQERGERRLFDLPRQCMLDMCGKDPSFSTSRRLNPCPVDPHINPSLNPNMEETMEEGSI